MDFSFELSRTRFGAVFQPFSISLVQFDLLI